MKFTLDWDIIKAILLNSNSKNFQLKKLPTQKTMYMEVYGKTKKI
jgi:hypothetical protein